MGTRKKKVKYSKLYSKSDSRMPAARRYSNSFNRKGTMPMGPAKRRTPGALTHRCIGFGFNEVHTKYSSKGGSNYNSEGMGHPGLHMIRNKFDNEQLRKEGLTIPAILRIGYEPDINDQDFKSKILAETKKYIVSRTGSSNGGFILKGTGEIARNMLPAIPAIRQSHIDMAQKIKDKDLPEYIYFTLHDIGINPSLTRNPRKGLDRIGGSDVLKTGDAADLTSAEIEGLRNSERDINQSHWNDRLLSIYKELKRNELVSNPKEYITDENEESFECLGYCQEVPSECDTCINLLISCMIVVFFHLDGKPKLKV